MIGATAREQLPYLIPDWWPRVSRRRHPDRINQVASCGLASSDAPVLPVPTGVAGWPAAALTTTEASVMSVPPWESDFSAKVGLAKTVDNVSCATCFRPANRCNTPP